MVLERELQSHKRQMAALSVSADWAASQWLTALSLLGFALEQRHVQARRMSSTTMRGSARCCHYLPTAGGETDSGNLKLVPFVCRTDARKLVAVRC